MAVPDPGAADGAPDIALAARLFDELRHRTGSSRGITRASYGLGEQIAHEIVRREALRLGLTCTTDAACNLYMTLKGAGAGPAIYVGSHLDSVPAGGNFDGAAGVLMGLAVVAGYCRAGIRPPQDITVMAIRAEESTWFGASYIGSRAAFGLLTGAELDGVLRSGDRVALGAAIEAAGGDTGALRAGRPHLDPARIGAFIEPHIEQGPVLVAEGLPAAFVTGIRGSFRHRAASVAGTYAHSGATPRANRQDAVLAAARLVTALDDAWQRLAAAGHDLTVTFGQLSTDPAEAAFSKVAGRVEFSLDIRSESHATLDLMRAELRGAVARIEADCAVRFTLGRETTSEPALMAAPLVAALEDAAGALAVPARRMACGAGHDAAVFAGAGVPSAMIFVRNANGSHNPDEAMEMADFTDAARILSRFCLRPLP
ncbi:Zn-dependent hydrolase [Halodurantibacterium flavum]|uniref:Zn-dependent hydrolase n=1 Tax=Halodurantibacterium flavum TaxID=1382802 RepID=A0ABW4S0R8_9RHOB